MEFLQGVLVLAVLAVFDLTNAQGSLSNVQSPRGFNMNLRGVPAPPGAVFSPDVMVAFNSLDSRKPVQAPLSLQEKPMLQAPEPFTWKFPIVAEAQREFATNFQLKQPASPGSTVAVNCGSDRVHVEVQQDLFSNGELIQPAGLTLGGRPVVGQDPNSGVFIFEYAIQDPESVVMMTEDELVYTYTLTYTPEAFPGTPIIRTNSAVVGVQCHYPRLHNVSSNALMPAWTPYASSEVGEDILVFSLNLMTDDWSYQRPSNVYFLGSVINIEASVMQYNHVPLRVYVDRCVATPVPDPEALPRYSFIENHGCLVDAKATGSSSHFLPITQEDKLRFQLEAFMFQDTPSPFIYITCIVKATVAARHSDHLHKSCSFANGWFANDGHHGACNCCDSTCGHGGVEGQLTGDGYRGIQWEGKALVGPVVVKDTQRNLV
nr:LOC100007710 protein [Danio rerio]